MLRARILAAAAAPLLAGALLFGGAGAAGAADAAGAVYPLVSSRYGPDVLGPARGRVLVVNFWATWCEPCREEMPALVAAARSFPAKELSVVLVSVDGKNSSRAIPAFLESRKVPFPCWLASSPDPQEFIDTVDPKWDGSLPHTVVYGPKGTAVEALDGLQTESSFRAAIQKAMTR
jgi:thiol-disulfide isomerase/thioredoxin